MANKPCPRCKGTLDYSDEYPICLNCGHVVYATDTDDPVEIQIKMTPHNIGELITALAQSKGCKSTDLDLGIPTGTIRQMAANRILHPVALVKLADICELKPSQMWRLIQGSAKAFAPSTPRRGRPKKDAD